MTRISPTDGNRRRLIEIARPNVCTDRLGCRLGAAVIACLHRAPAISAGRTDGFIIRVHTAVATPPLFQSGGIAYQPYPRLGMGGSKDTIAYSGDLTRRTVKPWFVRRALAGVLFSVLDNGDLARAVCQLEICSSYRRSCESS